MALHFQTRNVQRNTGIYKEVLLMDSTPGILCHLASQSDEKIAWLAGFLNMLEKPETSERCQRLIIAVPAISDCEYQPGDRATFLRMAHALLDFLQRDESQTLAGCQEARNAVCQFLERQFEFRATYGDGGYAYRVLVNGEPLLNQKYPLDLSLDRALPGRVPHYLWTSAILELREQNLHVLRHGILDYEFFHEAAMRRAALSDPPDRLFVLMSFTSFSKALVELLERDAHYADLQWIIPSICEIIVKNEHESLDEQKRYLERILRSQERPLAQVQRLWNIVYDIKRDESHATSPSSGDRLPAIVGLISDHFLENYDLDQAVAFWEKTAHRDPLLTSLVSLYQRPQRSLGLGLAFWVILAGLAHLNTGNYGWARAWQSWVPCLGLVLLTGLYILAAAVVSYLAYRIGWKRDLYYAQLFLPRLLGAIMVGLSVMLLQEMTWQIGIQRELFNFALICLGVYLLSFVFIFIVVYQAVKFLPASPIPGRVSSQPPASASARCWAKILQVFRHKPTHTLREPFRSTAERAVTISWRVYTIGVLESFLITLVTTSLLYPAAKLDLRPDLIGSLTLQSPWLSFAFFPTLVLMWTGLALFIGAFVQLIWQERRITSPV